MLDYLASLGDHFGGAESSKPCSLHEQWFCVLGSLHQASLSCSPKAKPRLTPRFLMFVGTTRFELATPCTPYKCATGLRHVPNTYSKLSAAIFFNRPRLHRDFAHSDKSEFAAAASILPVKGCKAKIYLHLIQNQVKKRSLHPIILFFA